MKNTIVFCLETDSEESYGEIANFIYKRETHLDITDEDTRRISYKYYLNNEIASFRLWGQTILKDFKDFGMINEPHKIKNITEQYEIIYCICVSERSDIIDLYNLYLLKHHYNDLKIVVLFQNCDGKHYFTISQFLYSVAVKDDKFYNECYFFYDEKVQRAQLHNISFSRHFTPLQVVDKENIKRLFQGCKDLVTTEYLEMLLTKEKRKEKDYDDLLDGAIKILFDVKKQPIQFIEDRYIQVFQKLDVLAFVLLCYSICQEKEDLSISVLEKYAFQMQQYSNAIRQLAENIVFHSKTGCGVIAIRLHDKKSLYIDDKYHLTGQPRDYLEIIVSDFCRNNSFGNIADNFVSNLPDDEIKVAFKDLQPKDFFAHEQRNMWKEFYCNSDNIGKHFGLRIFQSVVSTFNGVFGAESHSGYVNMPGDSFLSYTDYAAKSCMPGTRYRIVFPLENVQATIRKQDLSLDSGINLSNRINDFLAYSVGEIKLSGEFNFPQSQYQKNEQIRYLADYIRSELEKVNKDIVYFSLVNIEEHMGEIVAKAFTIALYQLMKDLVVVLYQCTDNMKKSIFDTMKIFYNHADIEGMFYDKNVQIIMYSKNYEEVVLELGSAQITDSINAYIAHMKCINLSDGYLNSNLEGVDLDIGAVNYIPCDVLYPVNIDGKTQTLFEHYTESILKNNIQRQEFGCKLEHTHMRLGSTIHIDKFYEAEILFGNKLFVSRFALLLVKDMRESIENVSKLTLYGYGTYSETVLVQMIEMIQNLYLKKKDVDYIILEREEERRGFLHKDRIRYNRYFNSKDERVSYFRDRKVAIVVLINSTLKTHMRLINLFREENDISAVNCEWLIKNYAVLLVGDANQNEYWKLDGDSVVLLKGSISPVPQYFVQVAADYQEPSGCKQCFPPNPVAEIPLIEVNAASTIPNQAFGVVESKPVEKLQLNYKFIEVEDNKLQYLKHEFVYGHVHRNENHFLYYFKTENICIKQKNEIKSSLRAWKEHQRLGEGLQFHIIVSPMHFSNAGFVELVNDVIFGGNAILLRIDFDKEYRCNAYTKYSYLRNYVEQLSAMGTDGVVRVHFVDDAIISGRTFHRAKSLMRSILSLDSRDSDSIEMVIFDKVFVLVDRNSTDSRRQYVANGKTDFYAFVNVNISSLRNYGDSCVYCNLKKETDLLLDTASTKLIADYWKKSGDKFQLYTLEEYNKNHEKSDQEKQYRRLFCTHMAQCVLKETYHGNNNVEAIYLILKLLNTDYKFRECDKYEYFLSYLKCISRPFLVFKKVIKEAIFDIMLILIDATVCNSTLYDIVQEIASEKPYLTERRLILQFNELDRNIMQDSGRTRQDKKDLVKLLMKQLTELKSNYIIRPEKMDAIFEFMQDEDAEKFETDYLTLIDRLVGASSDTNKSVWLDENIISSEFVYVPVDFRVWVLLENTRTFRDGIEKLYKRIYEKDTASKEFREVLDSRISELEIEYDYKRTLQLFGDFENKYKEELSVYRIGDNSDSEMICTMKKKIERFLKGVPNLEPLNIVSIIDSLKQSNDNWCNIFDYIKKEIENEYRGIKAGKDRDEIRNRLEWIATESDVYQFSNFFKLLQEDEYAQDSKLSADGADMIACCAKILAICRNEELAILEKVQKLAILFKIVLCAQKVQFIIENETNRNLDEWKHDIEKRYNVIVERFKEINPDSMIEKICIEEKRHYSIIVEKTGGGDYNTEVSCETEKLIEKLESKPYNYIIDKTMGAFLWKLENNQRSIWINIENCEWCSDDAGYEVKIAKNIRKVMMFYQELLSEIFNPENDDFINEISHARKELSIYNSDKTFSHTKDSIKEMLLEQAQNYFQNRAGETEYMKQYPSYVVKLLADIKISEYYRNGLRIGLYHNEGGIKSFARWSSFMGLIKNEQEFAYPIDKTKTVNIQLRVSDIDENDKVLCNESKTSINDMKLLIYALILNAAEQGRGKWENKENGIQTGQKNVIMVEVYKEKGYLVIENECENPMNIDEIMRKLRCIPDSEKDGISLWSFNCYIRRCINSLILARIKATEHNLAECKVDKEEIKKLGKWINKLTSQAYEIQPEKLEKEGKIYFRVKLPIFMEKYQCDEKGVEL